MNPLPKVGAHVRTVRVADEPEHAGVLAGFGQADGEPMALVRLHRPMWTEDRSACITVLCCHLDSVEPDPRRRVMLEEKHLDHVEHDGPPLTHAERLELSELRAALRPAWMVDR